MDIGAVLLILAVMLLISIFISRPFFESQPSKAEIDAAPQDEKEHQRSSLLAEYDQKLSSIQELEFDQTLGKIPPDEYAPQRLALLQSAADLLRQLDAFQEAAPQFTAEDRIEAAIQSRRAQTAAVTVPSGGFSTAGALTKEDEDLEALIAVRRGTRLSKAGGFCPKCGKPVQKTDRFCPKCGTPC